MAEDRGGRWLATLPPALVAQRRIMAGLLELCRAHEAARVLLVGCSVGRGAADELSDVDCFIGCADGGVDQTVAAVLAQLPALGDLVDALVHPYAGMTRIVGQYAGTVQLDLVVAPAVEGRAADEVVLYDPDGRLAGVRAVDADRVTPELVREWAFLGWESLAHLAKYLRRGSLWEALARLDMARERIWALWAAARGARYPVFGLSQVLDKDPADLPAGIEATVADLDAGRLRAAGRAAAQVLREVSELAAGVHGGELPDAMAAHVTGLLAALG
jgi:predicted nucleotidyltransferase